MISFLTLFLGLISGTHQVEVSIGAPVSSLELRLDGALIKRLAAPPWSAKVDFGAELAPHELLALALDERGGELGRAHQWINLPRPPAEVEIVLEQDEKGRATSGRLSAESLFGPRPRSLSATFDGRPLAIAQDGRFELPAYDAQATHLVTVAAEFSNGVRSRRDLVLGRGAASTASSELTALPVRFQTNGNVPEPATLEGWFVKSGTPLTVVAVEHGPAQVLIVRGLSADEAVSKLGRGGRTMIDSRQLGAMPVYEPEAMRREMVLEIEDRFRFVWPRARVVSTARPPSELFDTSHEFTAKDGGLQWLLTRVEHPARVEAHPRFADAVAIAGLHAVGSHGRRAVILVLGKKTTDASRYEPAAVRRYLERLGVPLFVWSLEKPDAVTAAASWGEVEDISTLGKLRAAFERFRRELDTQWIVWVKGEHRPQDIALGTEARGVEIVR